MICATAPRPADRHASRLPLAPAVDKPAGIDGSEVASYFLQGRIKEIADYCETDIVNTYRLWLRHELFRGRLPEAEYRASEADLSEFIKARAESKPHLQDFVATHTSAS